jgi:hypothetical protein
MPGTSLIAVARLSPERWRACANEGNALDNNTQWYQSITVVTAKPSFACPSRHTSDRPALGPRRSTSIWVSRRETHNFAPLGAVKSFHSALGKGYSQLTLCPRSPSPLRLPPMSGFPRVPMPCGLGRALAVGIPTILPAGLRRETPARPNCAALRLPGRQAGLVSVFRSSLPTSAAFIAAAQCGSRWTSSGWNGCARSSGGFSTTSASARRLKLGSPGSSGGRYAGHGRLTLRFRAQRSPLRATTWSVLARGFATSPKSSQTH